MLQKTVGRPMEILLVEDSLTSATITIGALKKGNIPHRLTWLSDGEEALEFLFQERKYARAPRPDLVLLDLGLPKRDGREVLAALRADERTHNIPVVVMTASTDPEDMHDTQELQVEGYLVKPVDLPKFLQLVQELRRFWHADMILPQGIVA
jgi:chemotaxis family two-component system response regulator Rcp1